jgi:hypothetical protein
MIINAEKLRELLHEIKDILGHIINATEEHVEKTAAKIEAVFEDAPPVAGTVVTATSAVDSAESAGACASVNSSTEDAHADTTDTATPATADTVVTASSTEDAPATIATDTGDVTTAPAATTASVTAPASNPTEPTA